MIIGVGIDIVEVGRMERILSRRGERFLNRIFTPLEIEYCRGRVRPAQGFAVRFAAKEAALKALGIGWQLGARFKDIEVVNQDLGAPGIRLSGRAREISRDKGVLKMHVTLSHSGRCALAQVIAEGYLSPSPEPA